MNFRSMTSIVSAVGLMTLASACGSTRETSPETRDGVSVTSGGLHVVESNEAEGKLVLAFQKDGRSITFDLRLGPKMQNPPSEKELAADPELPSFEVDAQVLDAKGQVFQQQMGGDTFLDPTWRMPRVEGFDEAGRAQDFLLLRDALPALRTISLPKGLEQLRLSAIQLGKSVDHLSDKAGFTAPSSSPVTGEGALTPKSVVLAVADGTVVKWDYRIMHKCVVGGGFSCDAWHTALILRGWTSGNSIAFRAHSCNHGSCATATDMSEYCVMSGFRSDDGTHTRYFYSETSTSTGSVTGGCSTGYGWSSTYSHNCNDDSELQRDAIVYDKSQCTNCNECHDLGTHNGSPGCI